MGWYEDHIDEKLDARGDITPPWAKYPTYERYTIGWRMGAGEDWLGYVSVFLDRLGREPEVLLAFLRRHPPAPHTWADWVLGMLRDEDDEDDGNIAQATLDDLERQGLIAADAAFTTYLDQTTEFSWPWSWTETPAAAMRYRTRDLEFFSRAQHSGRLPKPPTEGIPTAWAAFADLACGRASPSPPPPESGLAAMAHYLAAGRPPAPWSLGVTPESFEDSYDDDMGYADAFRLWLMSAFDDRPTWRRYVETQPAVPQAWQPWLREELLLPGDLALF